MTRILIAEDEERIVSFLEKGLQANGYTTIAVGSGPDAIACATRTRCCWPPDRSPNERRRR